MFPSEIVILMAIEEADKPDIQKLAHATDIKGIYLRYLCDSLIRRGYLSGNDSREYRVTSKGKEAILEVPHGMGDGGG